MVLAGQDTNRLLNLWHSGDQLPVLSDLIDKFGFIAEFGETTGPAGDRSALTPK